MKDLIISIDGETAAKEKKENLALQKKLKKIEVLKQQIERIKKGVLKYQKAYTKEILPDLEKLNAIREHYVAKLFSKLSQKSFSQSQYDEIRELITDEIMALGASGYTSEVLEEINEAIFEMSVNDLSEDQEDLMNDMVKEMARENGYDVDDENFNFEEFVKENIGGSRQRDEAQYNAFQEEAKEQKIKHTDKDFYKIYKSLAKKTHPDLVTDPEEKEKREQWMKRLSEVWAARNYMQLLQLQQEIEGTVETTISLEKTQYKSIITQLNKEIEGLETQKYVITSLDPNTAFYYQNFKSRSDKELQKKLAIFKEDIIKNIAEREDNLKSLRTQKTTKVFLSSLYKEDLFFDESISFDDDFIFGDF